MVAILFTRCKIEKHFKFQTPMATNLDSIIFFSKILTALVVILNIALILCLRSHVAVIKQAGGEIAQQFLKSKMVYGLVFLVIVINGAAVYANHQVRTKSTELKMEMGSMVK